jgi:MFS transporter, DHA1 family, inner membrane transport protein
LTAVPNAAVPPDVNPAPALPPSSEATTAHLTRWLLSFASYGVPQAAAPIAFSLVALGVTGRTDSGAAMILALTLAQVAGGVPVARAGARLNPVGYLRVLVAFRALAFSGVAILAGTGAGFPALIAASALAGLVSGAAYGYQRSLLNQLVSPSRLPRALGIAATLNEGVFVAMPVLASLLGTISPVAAVIAFAVLGAGPLVLIPRVQGLTGGAARPSRDPRPDRGRLMTRAILVWLCCATGTSTAVAAVEVGAVSLAVTFGIGPSWAFVFTVSLCIASVSGGVWVSVVNQPLGRRGVVGALGGTVLGSALVAAHLSVVTTMAGAVVIGMFLAPLSTHYSLTLDRLAPPAQRAETFAMLRTANSVGVILVSTLLTAVPLRAAMTACTAAAFAGALAVAVTTLRNATRRPLTTSARPPRM